MILNLLKKNDQKYILVNMEKKNEMIFSFLDFSRNQCLLIINEFYIIPYTFLHHVQN